jgi:ABC-type transport system involved in multi-copper enzyme maturation permease subunit
MIRFTWLQFRPQAAIVYGTLAMAAVVLALTGMHLAHLYALSGIPGCHARCGALAGDFLQQQATAQNVSRFLGFAVLAVTGLLGAFWGAPLVAREFETGSFRLAWTQGVTRSRWLAVKASVIGLCSVAAVGLLSLMLTWWASPLDTASMNPWAAFGPRDITPVGYAAFAFLLGVTAGMLVRRTLPAMAITLVIFAAVQVAVPLWVRPHLIAPEQITRPVSATNATTMGSSGPSGHYLFFVPSPVSIPGAWVLSPSMNCGAQPGATAACQVITPSRRSAATLPATRACTSSAPASGPGSCEAYIDGLHLRQVITYQPASRYWPFQWYETGIYLSLSAILAGVCTWWIRRRAVGRH